jgi:hypothetical protein
MGMPVGCSLLRWRPLDWKTAKAWLFRELTRAGSCHLVKRAGLEKEAKTGSVAT